MREEIGAVLPVLELPAGAEPRTGETTGARSMTVRERLHQIEMELLTGDPPPIRLRQMLMALTSLHGFCLQERRRADKAYREVYAGLLATEGKANRAKILAQSTKEFDDVEEADMQCKRALTLIQSMKATLQSLSEEMRLAR